MSRYWLGLLLLGVWLGRGGAAHAAFNESPNPLDFGSATIGQSSTQIETLSATGGTDVTVTIVLHGGADCSQFQIVSPTMPVRVRGGADQSVQVRFAPTTTGDKTCVVDVNQGSNPFQSFTVQGHAAAPQIAVTPATLMVSFSNVEVGSTSATQSVTATNNGDATLTISSAAIAFGSADYTLSGVSGATLAPMQSTTWMIACRPSGQGSRPGTFRIISDSSTNPTIDVTLACTGTQGNLITIPTSHDFGGVIVGSSVPFNFQLKNTGNLTVTSVSGALADTTKGYVFDPVTVPTSLAAGMTADLTVTFTPTSGTSGNAVNLNFQGRWGTNNTLTSAALALNGDGQLASFAATPSPLAFGNFRFDLPQTLSYHIKNTGDVTVSIDSVTFAPDLGTAVSEVTFSPITAGTTLVPNQQVDVTVTLAPNNRTGAISGKFTVHSNTTGTSDQQVTVTGNATAANFTATAMTDFGAVDVSATPPMKTVTITNTGNATLDINSIAPANGSSPAFTYMTLPSSKITVAAGSKFDIVVTYHPTTVRPPGDFDTAVLVATLGGVLNEPQQAMLNLQGRGIDSSLMVRPAPLFPATFRNPGDKAPVRAITVENNGEVLLQITQVTITGEPVWQLVDASPVDIPNRGSHDFQVKFAPTAVGPAPDGQLTLVINNGARPAVTVTLAGTCMDRNITFGPPRIYLGGAAAGFALTRSDALSITNLDPSVAFSVHTIRLSDDTVFHLEEDPTDLALPAGAAQHFGISFASTTSGHFETTASLYIDQDPEVQAEIQIAADTVDSVGVHGGGGCTTGNDTGVGAGIALVLLSLRRRVRRIALGRAIAVAALPMAWLATARPARADDVVIGVFDPTPATIATGFQLTTPEVGPSGSWVATSVASYATDVLVLDTYVNQMRIATDHAIKQRSMLALGGAYAFLDRFEAGLRLPIYAQRGDGSPASDTGAVYVKPASGAALGDLALHIKARLVRADLATLGSLTLGAALHATLPTATSGEFTGVDLPTARLLGLAAWSLQPRLTLYASAGGVLRKTSVYRDAAAISQGSGLSWGAGASLRILDRLWANAEIFGELTRASRSDIGMNTIALAPAEGLAGASYHFDVGVALGVAIGRGLTDGIGAPALRGVVTLSFAAGVPPQTPLPSDVAPAIERDSDGDGIVDSLDRCPSEPEDKDGFQDADGCPDPDNDGDGIADAVDKCPNEPEDKDGFQDADGCPDPDNDGDGIADAVDKCPNEPETVNGFQDADGCPDTAEPASVAPADQRTATKAAEETFAKGRELLKQAKYAEACAEFEQSQRLDPQFGTQYNLAGCYDKVGKLATAWNLYRELARSADTNPTRRARVAEQVKVLARRTPKIKLVLARPPAGVQVSVNGDSANALIGVETPVNLGSYTVVVDAAGYRPWRKAIEITEEAKVVQVVIDLEPIH